MAGSVRRDLGLLYLHLFKYYQLYIYVRLSDAAAYIQHHMHYQLSRLRP